jgi:23S rRNA (uracil1939-C5)-methyltransferase
MKKPFSETIRLEKIVGGGQTLGVLADGRKIFVWGGLPGETVEVLVTKQKNSFAEGTVEKVIEASTQRVEARDPESYLSTSPWQIVDFKEEQVYKSQLIDEAFALHKLTLPSTTDMVTDEKLYEYRNKVEFSFYWDNEKNQLDFSFFKRGSQGKVPVKGTSLAMPIINETAQKVLALLRARGIEAHPLKTLMLRANQAGKCVFQLYVKEKSFLIFTKEEIKLLEGATDFEIIFSNPKSPASVITKRLQTHGDVSLQDMVLDVPFNYAVESFFQGNIPVYELALKDMQSHLPAGKVVDFYSGVGSIGLTIGGEDVTMVESNEAAVKEMRRNITELEKTKAGAVLATAETATDYITGDATIILDPPRAGLHQNVTDRLLEVLPETILYLSCNPVTQARDFSYLQDKYEIMFHKGYNFFPRTPHIEHLLVLKRK